MIAEQKEIMLRVLLPAMARGDLRLCPRCCHGLYQMLPCQLNEVEAAAADAGWWPAPYAVSRIDNKTRICSPCGTDEALRDAVGGRPIPIEEWGPAFLDNEQGEEDGHDD